MIFLEIVIIAGKARSGKSEAARILKNIYEKKGKKAVISEYSKYIKLFAKELLGWDMKSEPKPRDFLQEMGDYVRSFKKDIYFVERMREDLRIYEKFVDVVIISDARLPQELDGLDEFGPIKIKVENCLPDYDLNEKQASHITEHALDEYQGYDYIIKNMTLEEVEKELNYIVDRRENS